MNFFNFGNLNFGSQLGNFGHNLDGDIQNFMKDLNSSIFPFFGPMMGFNFNNFGPFPHGQANFPTTHNSSTQTPNENNGQKYNQ